MGFRTFVRTMFATLVVAQAMTGVALAQEDPEQGDVGWGAPREETRRSQPEEGWNNGSREEERPTRRRRRDDDEDSTPSVGQAANWSGDDDHLKVIRRAGFGYFGTLTAPVGPAGGATQSDLSAPTIGARYWLSEMVGLEAALGLNIATGSTSAGNTTVDDPFYWGMGLHFGLPLALAHHKHFKFIVMPYLDMAFGGGTVYGATSDQDDYLSGFNFSVGGRVGAEIHFGFIGIPQLALQGSVGLGLSYTTRSVDDGQGAGNPSQVTTVNAFNFGTSLQNKPWDIFLGNISAIYYL